MSSSPRGAYFVISTGTARFTTTFTIPGALGFERVQSVKDRRGGLLTIIAPAGIRGRHMSWFAKCACGGFRIVTHGQVRSCGCLKVPPPRPQYRPSK
jgi:hypothetical protein